MNIIKRLIYRLMHTLSRLHVFVIYQMNSSDKANIAGMNCFKCSFSRKHFSQEEIDRLDLPVRFIKDPKGSFYISKSNAKFMARKHDGLILVNLGLKAYKYGNNFIFDALSDDELSTKIDSFLIDAAAYILSDDRHHK